MTSRTVFAIVALVLLAFSSAGCPDKSKEAGASPEAASSAAAAVKAAKDKAESGDKGDKDDDDEEDSKDDANKKDEGGW